MQTVRDGITPGAAADELRARKKLDHNT